ncbi:MAG TPA: sulfite exporter TauE/SafE family protein [Acidiferrobacterales bacterium]|jgi:sulfite exporter TauE/SafE
MDADFPAVLGLAFGLGLMHALDADHIMAVSGLASARRRGALAFCARWAVGHGLTLLGIGAAVLLLGMAIPERLSAVAEAAVGAVLIAIGAFVLWDLWRRRLHLHFHTHGGLPPHAHWHTHARDRGAHRHRHGALLVGVMHGAAGSAPLLALLPVAGRTAPWFGMAYLLAFGVGVLAAMLVFGGLIGVVFERLSRRGDVLLRATRALVALGAMGFGAVLLHG